MGKFWIIVLCIALVAIIAFAIFGYTKVSKNSSSSEASPSPVSKDVQAGFFSNDAKVMFFYSDYCHWCLKEEAEVLPELGKEGYRFKPMNLGENPSFGEQYQIKGTPTFIAQNGDRLDGYQEIGPLRTWLEAHK